MPTHGSLSKAGKVRSQTPKIESITRKNQIPRAQNRRKYNNREILGRNIGQYSPNKRRFRRRRR
jgi:small subunit ribosomal protein S30e